MSRQAHLFMIRPDLEGVPAPALPEGFSFRAYRPGDEAAWIEIIRRAYGSDWPEEAFQRYVLADASFLPERLFFIVQDRGPRVATAGAFQNLLHGDGTGYVHMMGVLPEFQRKGLGTALLRRCLLCFREQGRRDAVLDTDVTRLPAIRLYLANGFEPFPEVEADVEKWRTVLAALGRPDLSPSLKLRRTGTP